MSELLCSGVTTVKGAVGEVCNPGFVRGIFFTETKLTALAVSSAGIASTWTAFQKAGNTGLFIPFNDEKTAITTEVTKYADSVGRETVTNVIKKGGVYTVNAGPCSNNFGQYFKTQKSGYAFLIMSTNAVMGKQITASTIEQIEVSLMAVPVHGSKSEPWLYELSFNELEDWESQSVVVAADAGFNFQNLTQTNVQNLVLTAGTTNTLTTQSVFAWSPCGAAVTDLDLTGASDFLVKTAAGVTLAVSGATQVGTTNEYIVTFAAASEGATTVIYYSEPVASGVYWYLPFAIGLSVVSTAA